MSFEKLKKQMDFLIEVDKAKNIYRQNYITDGSRRENDAEHSWHLAMMAFVLSEHCVEDDLDVLKVMKMVLIHDIVEIDAGDTFLYDEKGYLDKDEREMKAAKRIYGILPEKQKNEMIGLWEEFEQRETKEAKFAAALDGLHPLINNYMTKGAGWKNHDVNLEKVLEKKAYIGESSPVLWTYAKELIEACERLGYFK
ncbi:MAG: HD domain-containing protein [Clostridiales bacterium]|nr:HD domain-containing protein [Clostridiales bacterium]